METIHLEFPQKDGILLTKKGLMQVNYYKELVVVKPLSRNKENLDLLRNYLREKLMRELKSDHLNHHQQTESTSNLKMEARSESEETKTEEKQSGAATSDQASSKATSSEWTLPPLLAKWTDIVLETMTKNPETVGRKLGKVDLEMKPAIFLGSHPTIHRMVLHRMVRFMRAAYEDHKSEDILVIHREQRPVPQSKGDEKRHILSVNDVLLLLPTTLSQSAAHLRFELGTHFCRKCKITMTVTPGEEVTCSCESELEILRCMGTIHSHGSMAAFSSGTDNKHEIPHIGFHMTVGNLDKAQESLVLSFCDGEVRIPLNISDLFATEKEDKAFDGQVHNWILFRRESKKKQEEERKKTAETVGNRFGRSGIRNIKIDTPLPSTGSVDVAPGHLSLFEGGDYDERGHPSREDWEDQEDQEEWDDDTLAMTRIENNRDAAMSRSLEKDDDLFDTDMLLEMIGSAYCGKVDWADVRKSISRCSWYIGHDSLERLIMRMRFSVRSMAISDRDYPAASALLEHLEFVEKSNKEAKPV